MKWLYYFLFTMVLMAGLLLRFVILEQIGGDYNTYKDAVNEFDAGINPYIASVKSYEQNTGEHGYAYFPTLLYILWGIWKVSNLFPTVISSVYIWKFPTLLSTLGLFYLIFKNTKNKWFSLFLGTLLLFSPYFIARFEITYFDPIFLLMLALAVETLNNKKSFLSGLFLALAISLKTIPIIFVPLFFFLNKDKLKFTLGLGSLFVLILLPFATSVENLLYVVKGSLFVHGERTLQGRPLLFFLDYYLKIPTFQDQFTKGYALVAMFLGTLVPLIMRYKYKVTNVYALVLGGFAFYMAFTPVLSRSHVVWPFVFLLLFAKDLQFKGKTAGIILIYWMTTFVYLLFWQKGFFTDTLNPKPHLNEDPIEWNLIKTGRHKYYEYRDKLKD